MLLRMRVASYAYRVCCICSRQQLARMRRAGTSALAPLLGDKRTRLGHCKTDAAICDIGCIELPPRSSLLPHRGVLKAREDRVVNRRSFITIFGWHGGARNGWTRLKEEHDASSDCDMRDTGWGPMVCGTHTLKSRRAVPGRDKCGRERIE